MLLTKAPFTKNLLRFFIAIFLSVATSSHVAAECSPIVINNYIDIDPLVASTFDNTDYSYYSITSGQSYDYLDVKGFKHNYTLNKQDDAWVIHSKPLDINIIAFFRQTINGAGGSAPQGTSDTLEILFNTGSVTGLNFIISDLDFFEGARVIAYSGTTVITPTVSNLSTNQTLSYLATGEAQWFSDGTSTEDSENTVSFDQPIDRLVISNYKTINGNVSDSGGFNLHELIATVCDTPKTIPTLSEWSLMILIMLLGLLGFVLKSTNTSGFSKNY